MAWTARSQLVASAEKRGVSFDELPIDEVVRLREAIISKLAPSESYASLWSDASDALGLETLAPWEHIGRMPIEGGVWMLFPLDEEKGVFRFRSVKDVASVLVDCSLFEFGLVGPGFGYFVWFDPHGFLLGRGAAAEWLDESI
ncbi:hypothetical protein [Myxococcus stipitatus]|uniref:hypothetical protein n=1 Tax=Myxococcus stipitatus TaxID=83455 RepID=UPI0011856AAF|nr:hypothetical protein [Myxococcus stipitatus]